MHLQVFPGPPNENFQFTFKNKPFLVREVQQTFIGKFVDYHAVQVEMQRIGKFGELFVFERECNLVKTYKLNNKVPLHVSVEFGDGLGFDILSYNPDGTEKFIEVKTTTGPFSTPFYITRTELAKSNNAKNNYYLYRVFNFDEPNKTADLMERCGCLEPLCQWPSQYLVQLTET